jgi:hypothetical protein
VKAEEYRVIAPDAARVFWNTGSGYCGSWSVQNTGITMGLWMGQSQGRKMIGDQEVLLGVNMDDLLDALHLNYVEKYSEKDNEAFLQWTTAALKNKESVIVGVKCHDSWCQDGDYDHIIPWHAVDVAGSAYSANDIVYYSDGFEPSELSMTFDEWAYGADDPNQYWYLPRHNNKTNWGVKITGMQGDDETIPISLAIDQDDEPNIAEGDSSATMTGNVVMTDLVPGEIYTLLRWDVDYTSYQNVPISDIRAVSTADDVELEFTAASTSHTIDISFYSNGITVFKLIEGTIDDDSENDDNDGDGGSDFTGIHDDFEDANLHGWTIDGDNAGIENENVHGGYYAAWLQRRSALVMDLDVSAVDRVTLSYWVDTWRLDRREMIFTETSTDGLNWTAHYSGRPTAYTYKTHAVDVSEADLLYIRFRTNANRSNEYGFVDDVVIECKGLSQYGPKRCVY